MDDFILSVACNLLGNDTVYSKLSDNNSSSTIVSGRLEAATAVGSTSIAKTTPTRTMHQKSRLSKHNNSRFRYGQEQQKYRKENNQVLSAPSESNKTTDVKEDITGAASDNFVLYWRSPVLLNQNKQQQYICKVNDHKPQHEKVQEECNIHSTCQSCLFIDIRFEFGTFTVKKDKCDNELIRMRIGLMISSENKEDCTKEYDDTNAIKSVRNDPHLSFSSTGSLFSNTCTGTYIMSESIQMHVLKNHILSLSIDWDSTPNHVLAQLFANALQDIGVNDLNENTFEKNEDNLSCRQCSISNILDSTCTNKTKYALHLQYKDFGQVSTLKFVHKDTSGSTDITSNATSRNDNDDNIIHCTLSTLEPLVMDMILHNLQHQDRHSTSTSNNNNNDNNISNSHHSSSASYDQVVDAYEKWKRKIAMKQPEEQEKQQYIIGNGQEIVESSNSKSRISGSSSLSLNILDSTIAEQDKQQRNSNDTSTASVHMPQSSDIEVINNENGHEKIGNTSMRTITENDPTNILTSTTDNTTASVTIVASSFLMPSSSSVIVQDAIESTNAKKNQPKRSQQQKQQQTQGRYSKISISQSTKRRKLQFTG